MTKTAAFVFGLPIMAVITIVAIDIIKAAASPVYEGFLADEFGILLVGIVWLFTGFALSTKSPAPSDIPQSIAA